MIKFEVAYMTMMISLNYLAQSSRVLYRKLILPHSLEWYVYKIVCVALEL